MSSTSRWTALRAERGPSPWSGGAGPSSVLLGVLALVLTGAAWASIPTEPETVPEESASGPVAAPRRVEYEGIAVELDIAPVDPGGAGQLREGRSARVRFEITDTATGQPLSGLYPAAWMSLLKDRERSEPESCVHRVEEFLGGSILSQAELDLNVYYVLALNHDATITVVDPLFGFGGTKLLALMSLHSPGEDWALSRDQALLFVSQPGSGEVAVASTVDWKVLTHVAVGPRPTRVALQGDGARVWIALDGADDGSGAGAVVLDAADGRVLERIATGRGPHDIAFSPDDRFAFLTNQGADTVSVIDVRTLAKVADLATGRGPASVAFSALAGAAYVSHEGDGTIVAVDGVRLEIKARMQSEPGLGQLRIAPDGRLGFAVNPRADTVEIFDVAKNRIVQTGDMKPGPDQISFTETLAYVHHRRSEQVLMIPIPKVGKEGVPIPVVDFPGGQRPAGEGFLPSIAPAIVRAPGAVAVLVANPADQMVYYYKEGMAAPMGGFENYERQPRAVMVVDRSLGERRRLGVYETAAKMRRPGRYEVAFFLDTPRIVHCFPVEVFPDPELELERAARKPAAVELLDRPLTVSVREELRLRFRLTDPHTGEPEDGLHDVRVLAFAAGNWNRRYQASGLGDGVYEVSLVLPEPGSYRIMLACPSQHLEFHTSPQLVVEAVASPEAATGGR